MSGPKAICIRPTPTAAELATARRRYAAAMSALRRTAEEHARVQRAAQRAGMHPCSQSAVLEPVAPGEITPDIADAAEAALRTAARLLEEERGALAKFQAELPARLQEAGTRASSLQAAAEALVRFATQLNQGGAGEEVAAILRERAEHTLACTLRTLEDAASAGIDRRETLLEQAERNFATARADFSGAIAEAEGIRAAAATQAGVGSVTSLLDHLATERPSKAGGEGDDEARRLNALLGDIASLEDDESWDWLQQRARQVRAEPDAARRTILFHSLAEHAATRLSYLRRRASCLLEIDTMLDCAAHVAQDADVAAAAAALEAVRGYGDTADLAPLRARMAAAVAAAERREWAGHAGAAVMDGLRQLGYEVAAGEMQTAVVEGGRLVFRRRGDDEYCLELHASADHGLIQTALRRYEGPVAPDQRARDMAREEEWCGEFSRLLGMLRAAGHEVEMRALHPAGHAPLRVEPRTSHQAVACDAEPERPAARTSMAEPT